MGSQQKLRLFLPWCFEVLSIERHSSREIRPAVPDSFVDRPENVRGAPNRAASSLIIPIIRQVKPATGRKPQAEWITKTPSH